MSKYLLLVTQVLLLTVQCIASPTPAAVNANYIFNAIHNSMRQFGSSLNHNGMSIFLATVPKDTELYHGTTKFERVNGTQWLAFEPEHALMYARGPMQLSQIHQSDDNEYESLKSILTPKARYGLQATLQDKSDPVTQPEGPGYFHTYRTRRNLRLLYVDGQSAAGSDKGTLDIQDYVLLPKPPHNERGEQVPFDDYTRAKGICSIAATEWQGKIDGLIRMETGFEIILCDFEKNLDMVQIVQAKKIHYDDEHVHEVNEITLNYLKAVAARYNGIGGGRVRLNYEPFVTLFEHPQAIYFNEESLPRIKRNSKAITGIRRLVRGLATSNNEISHTDWQAVSDMVVSRYARRISYLASGDISNLTEYKAEVDRAMGPFIDYSDRSQINEVERCRRQLLPSNVVTSKKPILAEQVVLNVTTTICSVLSSVTYDDVELSVGIQRLRELKAWLNWSDWKQCQGCSDREVCFTAIWPMGSKEDLESPQCRSDILHAGYKYWLGDWQPPIDTASRFYANRDQFD